MTWIPFDIAWQPIVLIKDYPTLPPFPVAAGQIQLQPPDGQDLATWWDTQLAMGQADFAQGQLELRLEPFMQEMARVRRWHLSLHPQVPPATRTWLPFWNEEGLALNWVYEVPVDQEVSDLVWNEMELARRARRIGEVEPRIAGSHVGRQGLTVTLAEALNTAPFTVLLLDPAVTDGLSNRLGVPGNEAQDARFYALWHFMEALRPDLPVVATGINTVEACKAVHACGVAYGQGDLWLPSTPLAETFTRHIPPEDPDWYPDKIYQTAEGWCAGHGLDLGWD